MSKFKFSWMNLITTYLTMWVTVAVLVYLGTNFIWANIFSIFVGTFFCPPILSLKDENNNHEQNR